jgi:hypothetical protein
MDPTGRVRRKRRGPVEDELPKVMNLLSLSIEIARLWLKESDGAYRAMLFPTIRARLNGIVIFISVAVLALGGASFVYLGDLAERLQALTDGVYTRHGDR